MILSERTLLYFTPFFFKSGTYAKPKYFIVIKKWGDNMLLAGLPSSQKHLPPDLINVYGCLESAERCINCYAFEAHKFVTDEGFSFPLDTYVYGQHLDEYETELLEDIYPIEGIDYEVKGQLKEEEFERLIDCFKNSASVKNKYKRLLK
jgi:hypothetical protein